MTRYKHSDRPIPQFFLVIVLAIAGAAMFGCASAGHGAPQTSASPANATSTEVGSKAYDDRDEVEVPSGEAPPISPFETAWNDMSPGAGVSENTPDRTRREPLPDIVVDVRSRMEEAYQSGLGAYRAGRFDEAKEYFDFAVDVVLSSGIDLTEQPALKRAFDEVVRDVAVLDADLYTREAAERTSDAPVDLLQDITSYLSPREAERERQRIEKFVTEVTYDLPMVLNPKVLYFVEVFQTRLRKEFDAGRVRSGRYIKLIKKIFREAGLPEDLAYMAHQESAYKNTAYSRARATGMWQFMSFTGRKYGLKRNIWVDERRDFEKATRAAAAYLKDNYARFGDWYLAMAAYNAGEGKIGRAIRRTGSRDFWKIARTRSIRRETKNYIPAILASILIDKSPADYGFDPEIDPPLKWDTLTIDKPTDLQVIADATGTSLKEIRELNPELRGLVTPPNVPLYTVRVPRGTKRDLRARLATLTDEERVSWTRHVVRRGENFTKISRNYKVPLRAVLDANPYYARKRLQPGTVINVPFSGGLPAMQQASARESRPSYEKGERVVHRVRRGDTLHRIASKYRTNVRNLKRWNRLDNSLIRPGQRIVAYYGERGRGRVSPPSRARLNSGERVVHKVRRGDTLSGIATRYRTTVKNLKRWNSLNSSMLKPGQKVVAYYGEKGNGPHPGKPANAPVTVTGARIQYRVQRGDNLTVIAGKFGVSVRDVCRWNSLTPRSVIYPGDRVWIGNRSPDSLASSGIARQETVRHRVRRGENLYRIAQRYNVSVRQVQNWNNLGNRSRIYPGQMLSISLQ